MGWNQDGWQKKNEKLERAFQAFLDSFNEYKLSEAKQLIEKIENDYFLDIGEKAKFKAAITIELSKRHISIH